MKDNTKKSNMIIVFLIFFIVLSVSLIIYIIFNKKDNLENNKNNTECILSVKTSQKGETKLPDIEIKNEEVKSIIKNINENAVCNDNAYYFHYSNLRNFSYKDAYLALTLEIYSNKYEKELKGSKVLASMPEEEQIGLQTVSARYIEGDVIRKGLEELFNIKEIEFHDSLWFYLEDYDIFTNIPGLCTHPIITKYKVIEYNELNDEINLTLVRAEKGNYLNENDVYRFAGSPNTIVYKDLKEPFEFTEENIDDFTKIKYIFKKNDNGNYYLQNATMLSHEDDFII